ncbi:MAG: SDR family NAD(P)-dependent oxidoreductase [Mariniblastus sp.]|nr:SDR family NAD(P)-dependent oxidoreductase [Mariniblastus sp.]
MNVLDVFRLDDQGAIVTGGSKGLGCAIAEAFAQAGANVLIASRTESELNAAAVLMELAIVLPGSNRLGP